jgi:hypothetical protein
MKLFAAGIVVLLVIAAIGVIGAGFLIDWIEDRRLPGSTAIAVEERDYSVEDYTERVEMYLEESGGASDQASLIIPLITQRIIEEGLLLQFASEKEVVATDEEVKEEIASTLGIEADDPNFDVRLQEELATIDLSEEQYRDIARTTVLKALSSDPGGRSGNRG